MKSTVTGSGVRFSSLARVALVLIAIAASDATADVICVPNDGIDGSCTSGMGAATIGAGILLAAPGDTVLVGDGTYTELVHVDRNIALLSLNGRAATTISPPANPSASLGTVRVSSNTTAVQIGAPGQGFTIDGIDNLSPAVESAAVYFQGGHSNAQVRDNEIVAAGDFGLVTEFGATISGFVIDGNEFSGTTFVGSPAGNGFGQQFTLPNVPRQLVVLGGGAGGGNTSNVTFTNNVVSGTAGGINPDLTGTECPVVAQPCEQGNTLVTIDSNGAAISGNSFSGTTTRFGASLRARGPSTTIAGNSFGSSGLTPGCGHIFMQNTGATIATVAGANVFDKGVFVDGATGTVGISLANAIAAAAPGATVQALAGTYDEPPLVNSIGTAQPMQILVDKAISVVGAGATQTVVRPTGNTGNSSDARGWFFVNATGTLNLSAATLDGTGRLVHQAIRNSGNGGSIADMRFTEIKYNHGGPEYAGTAIAAFGVAPVNVSDSAFDQIGRIGTLYFGAGVSGSTFSGNTYTGKGAGDFLDYMLDISAGAAVTVSGNSVSGNRGIASVDMSTSAGILVSTFFGSGTSADIESNSFANNTSGIVVGFRTSGCPGPNANCDTSAAAIDCNLFGGNDNGVVVKVENGAGVTANQNSFSGNVAGIDASAVFGGSIGATQNWWGAADGPSGAGPGSGDSVSANVTFSPFAGAPPPCVSCTQDVDCDDGLACNGAETCNTGSCQAGSLVDCSSAADECNSGACTEPLATCVSNPLPDGTPCNPSIDCSASGTCAAGLCAVTDSDGDGVCDTDERPALSLRRVDVKKAPLRPDRDYWTVRGELETSSSVVDFPDSITANGVEVIIYHDSSPTLTPIHAFSFTASQCVERRRFVRCTDLTTRSRVVLLKRSAVHFYRVRIKVARQTLVLPTLAQTPLSVSVRTNEGGILIDRSDDIGQSTCKLIGSTRVRCRELP